MAPGDRLWLDDVKPFASESNTLLSLL